jgi:hypothetical protein
MERATGYVRLPAPGLGTVTRAAAKEQRGDEHWGLPLLLPDELTLHVRSPKQPLIKRLFDLLSNYSKINLPINK